jgi:hypothetical protein
MVTKCRSIRARTTEAGNPTWSYPHNCKGDKGVYMKDVCDGGKTVAQKAMYAKASELLQLFDNDYASNNDYVINFSCMDSPTKHYVREHTDSEDIAPQYAMVLGDCTGGELKVWDSAGSANPLLASLDAPKKKKQKAVDPAEPTAELLGTMA